MISFIKILRIIGDDRKAIGYNETIKENEAQKIADFLCSRMKWNKIKVSFSGKETKRKVYKKEVFTCLGGEFIHDTIEIILHKPGENIGTLLHELAHYKIKKHHNKNFKQVQLRLTEIYLEHYETK